MVCVPGIHTGDFPDGPEGSFLDVQVIVRVLEARSSDQAIVLQDLPIFVALPLPIANYI